MGKEIGDPEPALTPLLKFPVVLAQEADFSKEDVRLLVGLKRLSMQFNAIYSVPHKEGPHPPPVSNMEADVQPAAGKNASRRDLK